MRRLVIISILLIAFFSTAHAGFKEGIDAYNKKDYRNALKEFKPLAEQGDTDSQFMIGYMYASGKGVIQDYIQAHLWFNLSAAQGEDRAAKARDKIAEVMTPSQIAEAQAMARNWRPKEATERPETERAHSTDASGLKGSELLFAIQENLKALGYDPGPSDGKMGSKTRLAIRQYQRRTGLVDDGEPSQRLLEKLQKDREKMGIASKSYAFPASTKATEIRTIPEKQTQEVIDQLKIIVHKGEVEHRVDQSFLKQLQGLIQNYDWPWRTQLFQDDFQDGDFTRNPSWIIISGDFWVDSQQRLAASLKLPEQRDERASSAETEDKSTQILKTILGEILKEKGEEPRRSTKISQAEIYSTVGISNHFSMDIEIMVPARQDITRIEIGPYKGRKRDVGYRIRYVGGRKPVIELRRPVDGASSVIEVSKPLSSLSDGRNHIIQWQRYSDGTMIVGVDGKAIIRTVDRAIKDSFEGISIINFNGEFVIPSISIFGSK